MEETKIYSLLKLTDTFSLSINKSILSLTNFSACLDKASSKFEKAINAIARKISFISSNNYLDELYDVNKNASSKTNLLNNDSMFSSSVNNVVSSLDRINKIIISSNTSLDKKDIDKKTKSLTDKVYKTATSSGIKVNGEDIISVMEEVYAKTKNLSFAENNIDNFGIAIRAFNASVSDVSSFMSMIAKNNISSKDVSDVMDSIYYQGEKGGFSVNDFMKNSDYISEVYSPIGTSYKDILNANAALQIFNMKTKNANASLYMLENSMADFTDSKKQESLKKLGSTIGIDFNVYNANKEMKDLNDIILNIVKSKDKLGYDFENLKGILSEETIESIKSFDKYGSNYNSLTNTSEGKNSARKLSEMKSEIFSANITNFKTSYDRFLNTHLAPMFNGINGLFNSFSANPNNMQKLAGAVLGIEAIFFAISKASEAGGMIGNIKTLIDFLKNVGTFSGVGNVFGKIFESIKGKAGALLPNIQGSVGKILSGVDLKLAGMSVITRAGIAGGLTGAIVSIPQAIGEWQAANNDPTLTTKERNKKKGGAIGFASGSIIGGAAGAMAGAASAAAIGATIGSVVPGLGTAIGAVVGAGVGLAGGFIGRKVGEKIGEAITDSDSADKIKNREVMPHINTSTELKGNANIVLDVNLKDERTEIKTNINSDINGTEFSVGSVNEAYSW